MIWKASILSSILISLAFAALWLQRRATAEQRRLTCACALVACAIVWVLAFVPSNWLPAVQPNPTPKISATVEQVPASSPKNAPTASTLNTARTLVDRASLATVRPEFGWQPLYLMGVWLTLLLWLGGWVFALRMAFSGRTDEGLRSRSHWRTCLVPRLTTPLCLGWPCRCILLPVEAAEWDASTLEMVIRHEESHIRRQDHAWMHLAHLLCIAHWFNPLAWILARRLRIECEHVADNTVLSLGVQPSRYAEVLLAFQASGTTLLPLGATQPMFRRSGLALRLESILSPATRRNPMNRRNALIAATVAVCGCGIVALYAFGRAKQVFEPATWYSATPASTPHPEYSEQREAEVGQIGMMNLARPVIWDRNGSLVPEYNVVQHKWQPDREFALTAAQAKRRIQPHARYAHIVVRVKALPSDGQPEASAEIVPEPNKNNPGAGTDLPTEYVMTKDGWHYFVSPHAVFPEAFKEKTDRKDIGPFGHGLATGTWRFTVGKPVDEGSIDKLHLFSKWTVEPAPKSNEFADQEIAKLTNSKVWTKVQFRRPTMVWQMIHFFRRDGSEIPDSLVSSEYFDKPAINHFMQAIYYVGVPAKEIGDVRVTTRKSVDVTFSGIPLSPQGGPGG
ncbi:MAG: M56 family metallopeptidase [Fimbriimonas sp.]|nr:M56 family metallopeptidase [Fimbriimonas sp.]